MPSNGSFSCPACLLAFNAFVASTNSLFSLYVSELFFHVEAPLIFQIASVALLFIFLSLSVEIFTRRA